MNENSQVKPSSVSHVTLGLDAKVSVKVHAKVISSLSSWHTDIVFWPVRKKSENVVSKPVFPKRLDQNSPFGRNFAPKIATHKKTQNQHYLQQEFWKKLLKIAHFAQKFRPISKVTKNRPNYAGDFCKNIIATQCGKVY